MSPLFKGRDAIGRPRRLSATIRPSDAEQSRAGTFDHDKETVAWSADVEPGVRVNLELRVTSDRHVYVDSVRVTNIGDECEAGSGPFEREEPNIEVGDPSTLDGTSPQPVSPLVQSRNDNGGDNGDKQRLPHDSEPTDWPILLGRVVSAHSGRSVRLALLGGVA